MNKDDSPHSSGSPVSNLDKSVVLNEPYNKNHIYAEKKRRQNISKGFDSLRTLINGANSGHKVQLRVNLNKIKFDENKFFSQISNARLLQKSYEHIKQMKILRTTFEHKIKTLKLELKALNESIR